MSVRWPRPGRLGLIIASIVMTMLYLQFWSASPKSPQVPPPRKPGEEPQASDLFHCDKPGGDKASTNTPRCCEPNMVYPVQEKCISKVNVATWWQHKQLSAHRWHYCEPGFSPNCCWFHPQPEGKDDLFVCTPRNVARLQGEPN